jgi:hypothetical protein
MAEVVLSTNNDPGQWASEEARSIVVPVP